MLVEVKQVSAASNQHPFPFDSVLNTALRIVAIEAYKVGDMAVGPESGNAVANNSCFSNSMLVLGDMDGKEAIKRVPLSRLNPAGNSGHAVPLDVDRLSPSNCHVFIKNTTPMVAGEVWVFGVWYE